MDLNSIALFMNILFNTNVHYEIATIESGKIDGAPNKLTYKLTTVSW